MRQDYSGRTLPPVVDVLDLTAPEQTSYDTFQTTSTAEQNAANAAATQRAADIAADKTQVIQFMGAASGTATPTQRDDTIKAIVRYLRRRGDDA
jgi:hypothetical protein